MGRESSLCRREEEDIKFLCNREGRVCVCVHKNKRRWSFRKKGESRPLKEKGQDSMMLYLMATLALRLKGKGENI